MNTGWYYGSMITIDSEVGWLWVGALVTGTVLEVHPERHEIISKGKHIARNGTPDDPALVIRHASGSLVLKLQHEVQELSGDKA
jgi:Hypervirulence associated proteins TUDOR domain